MAGRTQDRTTRVLGEWNALRVFNRDPVLQEVERTSINSYGMENVNKIIIADY